MSGVDAPGIVTLALPRQVEVGEKSHHYISAALFKSG